MIKNLWKQTKFICSYRHEPTEMTIHEGINGASPFYSCPHYYEENRAKDETRACPMRLNFVDAEALLDAFSNAVEKDIAEDKVRDYSGYEYDYKTIHADVINYNDKELNLNVYNKKSFYKR